MQKRILGEFFLNVGEGSDFIDTLQKMKSDDQQSVLTLGENRVGWACLQNSFCVVLRIRL